jgi:2-phospho-L-lactate guanylyltransferase
MKELSSSKTRLSNYLTSDERCELSLSMLKDVVTSVMLCKYIDYTIIVTPDAQLKELLAEFSGIDFIYDKGISQTLAVEYAISYASKHVAPDITVICVADIPLLQARNLDEIISIALKEESCVLAPSSDGGTNVIAQHLVKPLKLMYGPHSFEKHLATAKNQGIKIDVYRSSETLIDVDTIDDLRLLSKIGCHGYTSNILNKIADKILGKL